MPHELDVISKALDNMLLYEREQRTAAKTEEYGSVKNSFYASELGDGDRKLVYKWFADRIGAKSPLTGQNIRVFDNGDSVHERYLGYFRRMGAVLSFETPVKAHQTELEGNADEEAVKDLENFYRVSGRYDEVLDMNVVKAYAQGHDAWAEFMAQNYHTETIITREVTKETGESVDIKEEVRYFPNEDYEPSEALIDIKSMNEWGFNRLVDKQDHSDIQGYFDQLSYYMKHTGIHKSALVIEDKAKNRLHIVPVDYDETRIVGGEGREGIIKRLARLYQHVKNQTVPEERCDGAKRDKFPCLWSTGQCEFYSHCWNEEHNGLIIPSGEEEIELPSIEELVEYLTDPEYGVSAIVLKLDGYPGGQDRFVVTNNMPEALINQMMDFYADYVVDVDYLDAKGEVIQTTADEEEAAATSETTEETEPEVIPGVTNTNAVTNENGEFFLDGGPHSDTALEQRDASGQRFINCVACNHKIVYQKLVGGCKPCPKCSHRNPVLTQA